ncbi:uncharacterized protein L3040_000725 [Drepanopeziza brunnea f. sp. 'multigermtubi']|uniref:uncharacterized protein n=1 Tax=Drepanopeziza brunnea f. sp. 'multigermtubi' TaxID=698441 RepID=UPI0023A10ACA|nr:hypothetical protein L3040_000725 [Drepanopeziza brunnea f. sp. 'multigermtubi']
MTLVRCRIVPRNPHIRHPIPHPPTPHGFCVALGVGDEKEDYLTTAGRAEIRDSRDLQGITELQRPPALSGEAMAIFGRKKTTATTTSTRPEPEPIHSAQFNHPGAYANSLPPSWTYLEQRPPQASLGRDNGSPAQAQGWQAAPVHTHYQPVLVENTSKLNLATRSNLLARNVPDCPILQHGITSLHMHGTQYLNQGAALCDLIASEFDNIITLIDEERFRGDERELAVFSPPQPMWQHQQYETEYADHELEKGKSKGIVNNCVSSPLASANHFSKVYLYANSRLPQNLPPLKLYIPTFSLLCLAAQYSEQVYKKPTGQEKEVHLDADWRLGTKAVVIKSIPMDDMRTIIFAIRGTQSFMDWAVNMNSAPASPEEFLDDPGNLCHAGFLTVAKKMIKPVAARLRHLLEEDPGRSRCSLMITGHSAGGAVAALLYSHMLATAPEAESELNILTGCFKQVHCVTFGAPPVSLLPLSTPSDPALRESLFLSFVNEGDPVARADKAYVCSLLNLYSSPAPGQSCAITPQKLQPLVQNLKQSSSAFTLNKWRPTHTKLNTLPNLEIVPYWPIPEALMSNAGRIVLLRSVEKYEERTSKKRPVLERTYEGVAAQIVTDELLRGVLWGDPMCHMMRLYTRRIEILATNAVTGRS